MIPEWLIPIIVWLLAVLVFVMLAAVLCGKLFWNLIRLIIQAKKHVEEIKTRTAEKYNKIATLSPTELDDYLGMLYGIVLEVAAITDISERDPDGSTNLYSSSLARMLAQLGERNIEAIEYYYGGGWVERWCELRYKYLENTGVVTNILTRRTTATGIFGQLNTTRKETK